MVKDLNTKDTLEIDANFRERLVTTATIKLGCNRARALEIVSEIGKVRCWLTGYKAGSGCGSIMGEDTLRQIQILLKEAR